LGSIGIRPADLLDRAVEVSEDPPHLFLQESEARGPESVRDIPARFAQHLGRDAIRRLQVRRRADPVVGNPSWFGSGRVHLPPSAGGRRDGDLMEGLSFLVGDQRHPEGEEEEHRLLGFLDLSRDASLRGESRLDEGDRDPIRSRVLAAYAVPSTATGDQRDQLLEEVTPRGDELRLELSAPRRIEGQREGRRDFQVEANRLRDGDPDEGGIVG